MNGWVPEKREVDGSDDVPLQLGDFLVNHVKFSGVYKICKRNTFSVYGSVQRSLS